MKVIEISQKTHLIRHWFKWYRVQRGGTDWQPLEVKKRSPTIAEIQSSLAKFVPDSGLKAAPKDK